MDDDLDTILDIMKGSRFATVTTRGEGGHLFSRPLAVLDHDFDGKVWFFTPEPSPKTAEVLADPHVNVAYSDGASHVSLSGEARVTRDPELIDRFWNPWAESWFEGGREDPAVALLEVEADTVEFWHVDKPALLRAVEVAKGLVTGSAPDVGESRTVDFRD